MLTKQNSDIRKGCQDMWNAFMLKGAEYTLESDLPICPCTAKEVPKRLISFPEAKHVFRNTIKTNPDFHVDAFVHFYTDDQKFDGPQSGIWARPMEALEIICHFSGVITPDFSTNADFPDGLKRYNTLRMRQFGYWLTTEGIEVINNVRWGTEETWDYCFDSIPYNSMVAIGTVASGIRMLENRPDFEIGLFKMVEYLNPHTIIIYGSGNYDCFKKLEEIGIRIVVFPSETNLAYQSKKGGKHV